MALATRCPHCQTAFKVANDQLKLHAGLVRCGSCQQTFNGVENLIPVDGAKTPAAMPARPAVTKTAIPAIPVASVTAEVSQVTVTPATRAAAPVPAASSDTPSAVTPVTIKTFSANGKPGADVLAQAKGKNDTATAEPEPAVVSAMQTPANVAAPTVVGMSEPRSASDPASNGKVEPQLGSEFESKSEQKTLLEIGPVPDDKKEPVIGNSSDLDFDLGDNGFFLPSEEDHEADLARIELETRAALMDPPATDWSVSDGLEVKEEQVAIPAEAETHESASTTKVWRHKDHGEAHELEQADSITDDVLSVHHNEPYIGDEEAALANHAAINEDSSSDVEEDEHKPNFVIQAEKQRARKRIANVMYSLMVVMLVPLLAGQSAYVFRNQLAARVPETKPYLQQACKLLQCQVTLPAQIDKIVVDSNELQNLAPERNVFMLVMQIQNQSDVVQTWPNIELVLNDVKEKPLLQRIFTPEDYLNEKSKLANGFAASGEQNIKLYFELPAIKAAGFHVGVFYP